MRRTEISARAKAAGKGFGRPLLALAVVAGASFVSLPSARADGVLFSDNFNAEPVQLSVSAMNQWAVEGGTIDVFSDGAHGLRCPDDGQCLDLDGSTFAAGKMISNPIKLAAGSYILSYQLSGNQRGGEDAATIRFGTKKLRTVTLASDAPFKTFSDKFTLTEPTTASISIQNEGGDNVGLVLDNVVLASAGPLVTGAARTKKTYVVTCRNVATGQTVQRTFLSLQTWDCSDMGLTLNPGEAFKATVTGRAK